MAIYVKNQEEYQRYREAMTPILRSIGGKFGYDLSVDKVIKSKCQNPINRIFTIEFPSKAVMQTFFNREDYCAIRDEHLAHSVSHFTVISMHEKTE